jgi:DNA-3-methyladenine glycosylase I
MSAVALGDDGVTRCAWGDSTPEYRAYHDTEWGFPVADDTRLFEKLCLEGFRAAFAGFDPEAVARFGPADVERLLGDAGIVRHRGKIESTINNAQRALELIEAEGSLAAYVWRFEPDRSAGPSSAATTDESRALAKDLKRRGWTFVGPTTVYAFMQAMGLVDDHAEGCAARAVAERARAAFTIPA